MKQTTIYRANIFIALLIFSLGLSAQTGPGGVGNSAGSPGQPQNVIWFDASSLSLNNSDPVAAWTDISGNGNDATQATGSDQPTYLTGQINGLPAIQFDGTDDFMPFDGSLITNTDYTVIFVGKRRTDNGQRVFLGGTTSSTNQNLHLYWEESNQFRAHQYSNDLQTDMVDPATVPDYSSGTETGEFGIFSTLLASSDASDQRRNYQNNHFLGSRSDDSQLSSYTGAAIGRYTTNFHDVDAAEIIIYSNALNDAQLQIVHQYLNIKYGIVIDNDLFSPDGTYITDIAGIGKASSSDEHTHAESDGMHIAGLSGLNSGDYLFAAHNNAANSSSDFTNADLADAELRYNRVWEMHKTNTPAARIAFDFSEAVSDGKNPVNIDNYVLLYSSDPSSVNFTTVKTADGVQEGDQVYFDLADTDIQDGYYTLGTADNTNTPLEGSEGKTWYTLISDDWDNWETWTLDPSGALPNNPDKKTPTTSATNTADKVVILTGKTITVSTNNKANAEIDVEGRLDLGTTTGHSFGKINGNGRIVMKADNFPVGDPFDFVSAGHGEGTVEYEGDSYDLSTLREFYDMEVNLNTGQTISLLNEYTINGNLTVKSGTLQINDDTNDQKINLTISGNLTVGSGASITTGTGNPFATNAYSIQGNNMPADADYHSIYHQLTIGGDFQNDGTVRFTNLSAPVYNEFATDGAVTVTFTGAANNKVTLNGQTDFYNLIVDKGVNKNYELNLYSSAGSNFTLFGANSVGRFTSGTYSVANPLVRKALFVKTGTLKLTGDIDIPTLSEGDDDSGNGDYAIGENARLWIAGSNVTVYSTASAQSEVTGFESTADGIDTGGSNQALSLFGEFRISAGFFGTRNSAGFIFWSDANAQVKVEGGTVNVSQMRSSNSGSGQASYTQSGGLVEVRGNADGYAGSVSGSLPIFGFESSTGVFNMSGGELLIKDTGGSTTNGFYIPSAEGNYNVTGGTVTVRIASGNDFEIGSTAPIWDLNIEQLSGTGTSIVRLTNNLTVSNDLSIDLNCRLDVQDDEDVTDYDLYIGDDFNFQSGAEFYARSSTTHFIGSTSSTIRIDDTSTEGDLTFNNLTISKEQNWNPDTYDQVIIDGRSRTTGHPVEIQGNLLIERGDFDTDDYEVDIHGNIEITDGLITNGTGKIVLNGTSQQTLEGPQTEQVQFGTLELLSNAGALLLSDIAVTDFILTTESDGSGTRIVDLDTYNLDVSGDLIINNGSYSSDVMYKTAGNAGDGGITRYIDLSQGVANTEYLFPIGTGTDYNPAKVIQSGAIADAGRIAINPVNSTHPSSNVPSKTIPYHWVVDTVGFSTTLAFDDLKYTFTYNAGTIPGAASKLICQWSEDYEFYEYNKNITGSDINFPYEAYLTGDYTVGNHSDFKNPVIYYSTTVSRGNDTNTNNGDLWTDSDCWSTEGHYSTVNDGTYPQKGDIAIIGFGLASPTSTTDDDQRSHWFFINTDIEVGKIIFADEVINADGVAVPRTNSYLPQVIVDDNANLDFIAGTVNGEGTFNVEVGCGTCDTDPDLTTTVTANIDADFSDFAANTNSRFDYDLHLSNNTTAYLPTSFPEVYPNVHVKGQNGTNRKLVFQEDILIKGDLTIRQDATVLLSDKEFGDFTVYGDIDFTINTGSDALEFPTSGYERTFTLNGDIIMGDQEGDIIRVLNTTPSGLTHTFRIGGNIRQERGNTIDLFSDNSGGNNVILEFFGSASANYYSYEPDDSNDATAQLYRIIMNKEAATEWVAFNFMDAFTLGGPTDGDDKAIELISGRLGLRDPGIDVTLTSGGADFKIPEEAKLWLGSGATARVSGDNTGIWLDGQLDIGNAVNAYFNEGTNNYIEYTATGTSDIYINGGNSKFYVGSQIRRSTTTEEGVLNFRLTAETADVRIGTNAGNIPENNRGVFEILNTGSNLEMADNATITIANAQDNPLYPAVYLDPETSTLGTGSTIQFGNDDTDAAQTIGLYANINLKNIDVVNNSVTPTDPTAKIWYQNIAVDENITIGSGTELDADGWDITINGNWTNDGNYVAGGNTVYFSGASAQAISGTTNFYNFTKTSTNQVNINNAISIENNLDIQNGTLADGGNTITVLGDINNDGIHVWGGDPGLGLYLNGSEQQTVNTSGIFGKITIDNTAGVYFPTEAASIVINDAVEFRNGIMDIGKNLMELDEDAAFIEAAGYSENNMIQTNLSFTDNGVKKVFPDIAATTEFIFPIGSEGKYTPIELSINNIDAGGSIRVKAADERQSTVTDDNDECNEFVDTLNVLQYHWVMDAENVTNFTASAVMRYYAEDAVFNNTHGYDLSDYITARLLEGGNAWNKYDNSSFDQVNQTLAFYFNNTNTEGISGDYTAGIEQETGCNGAIPNEVPMYISIQDGPWNLASTWETYPDGDPGPAGGPRGAIVIINNTHTVTAGENYILNYKTEIRSGGTLAINTTFGHRLGLVSGGGTLYMERGDLPAAVFDKFIYEDLGTFEFGGSDSYDILSELPAIHNLKLSGTGERRFPNLNLSVRGNLIIDGDDNTLQAVNEHNETINVKEDITFNNGIFEAGTGVNAVFVIDGNNQQTINGTNSFTGTNAFNHFEMNNPGGLLLERPVDIDNNLTFEFGVITTDATNILTLENTGEGIVSGASSSAYVNGPLNKNIDTGISGTFEFPTGKNARYGKVKIIDANTNGYWQAEYYNANPNIASTPGAMNPESLDGTLKYVSDNEYWRVKAPAAATAKLELRWDNYNGGFASNPGDMRIAEWNQPTASAWNEFDASPTAVGDNTAGTITTDIATSYNEFPGSGNFFTIASVYESLLTFIWEGDDATNPNNWNVAENWSGGQVPGAMDDIEIPSTGVTNEPIIYSGTAAEAAAVDLQTGRTLTINAGGSLTSNGAFTMNGDLIIKSPAGSGASGSFIDNGISGNGSAQIERYLTRYAFHYVSMPVEADAAITSDMFTDIGSSYNPNFYIYDETLDLNADPNTAPAGVFDTEHLAAGWLNHHGGETGSEQLFPKIGYAHYHDAWSNQTAIFNGTPNTGEMLFDQLTYTYNDPNGGDYDAGVPQLYDGWNLVGNPYPSSVDWDQVVSSLTNIDAGIYVWDEANGGYASYVNGISGGTGNQTQYIAPMQAFFVRANGADPEFTLSNSDRAHSSNDFLKNEAKNSTNESLLAISISANGRKNITNVYFHPKATESFDKRYDAVSIFPASYQTELPTLYSIGPKNTVYSTNALPENATAKSDLPIGVRVLKGGNYTLNFNASSGLDSVRIFMEDKYTGDTIYIKNTPSYSFDHAAGDVKDRFVLHFKENKAPVAVAEISDKQFSEKEAFSFTISQNLFTEPDAEDKIVKIEAVQAKGEELPEFLSFDNETFTFSGEAQNADVGIYELSLKAYDLYGASASINFSLEIINVNDAPILQGKIKDQSIFANEDFNLLIDNKLFVDIDTNDELNYSASYSEYLESGNMQTWLMFDSETLEFYGAPTNSDAGTFTVILRATDLYGAWNDTEFDIEVKQTTGVNDLANSDDPYLYPNPAREGFFIAMDRSSSAVLTITDIKGTVVRELTFNSDKHFVPTESLASGMYIVKVRSNQKTHFLKLFVE
jgi:hypothetical protein